MMDLGFSGSIFFKPARIARAGSSGVESILKEVNEEVSGSKTTKSVNVPPVSIPILILILYRWKIYL
jgi:hypothetical protein